MFLADLHGSYHQSVAGGRPLKGSRILMTSTKNKRVDRTVLADPLACASCWSSGEAHCGWSWQTASADSGIASSESPQCDAMAALTQSAFPL